MTFSAMVLFKYDFETYVGRYDCRSFMPCTFWTFSDKDSGPEGTFGVLFQLI